MPNSAAILKQQFFQSLGLPWTDILLETRLDAILKEEEIIYRTRVYPPSSSYGQCSTKCYPPTKGYGSH